MPASANLVRLSLKPSKIIPSLKNLLEINPIPGAASSLTPTGKTCKDIPNSNAITKAPIKLRYGNLAIKIPATEQIKVITAARPNDLLLTILINKKYLQFNCLFQPRKIYGICNFVVL